MQSDDCFSGRELRCGSERKLLIVLQDGFPDKEVVLRGCLDRWRKYLSMQSSGDSGMRTAAGERVV